jgi:hypothetical protein
MFLFGQIHVFLPVNEIHLLEQNEPVFNLKSLICRKYSFKKPTQFSQGNDVIGAAASKRDVFFGEIHVFPYLS